LSLQSGDHFLDCGEAFKFHAVPFVNLYSQLLGYWSSVHKVITCAYVSIKMNFEKSKLNIYYEEGSVLGNGRGYKEGKDTTFSLRELTI
jgi:hypothetical protein